MVALTSTHLANFICIMHQCNHGRVSLFFLEILALVELIWFTTNKNIFAFSTFLNIKITLKFSSGKKKDQFKPYCQLYGCWSLGDAMSQSISSHGIDLVLPEYSGFRTRGVHMQMYYSRDTGWQCCSRTLQWRHNGRDSVSSHQPHDCLLNGLFGRRLKKAWKLRVTGLCAGNSPVFPAQMDSDAENVSIWWRHHGYFLGDLYVSWSPAQQK